MAQSTMYSGINNSPQTTTTAEISATAQTISVDKISAFPAAPNLATLGAGEEAEVIQYSGIQGNTLTGCLRGYDGTTASVWPAGTIIYRAFTLHDYETLCNNIRDLDEGKQNADTAFSGKAQDLKDTPSGMLMGASGALKAAQAGKDYATPPSVVQISLSADGWTGEDPYAQAITIEGVTAKSKIDLQPDAAAIAQLVEDKVQGLYVKNENSVCTAIAIGAAPSSSLTVQATVTEVM